MIALIAKNGFHVGIVTRPMLRLLTALYYRQAATRDLTNQFPDLRVKAALSLLEVNGLVEVIDLLFTGYSRTGREKHMAVWRLTEKGMLYVDRETQ